MFGLCDVFPTYRYPRPQASNKPLHAGGGRPVDLAEPKPLPGARAIRELTARCHLQTLIAAQEAKRAAVSKNKATGWRRTDDDDPPMGKGTPGIGCLLGLTHHQPGDLDGLLDLHSTRYQFLESGRPAGKIVSPGPGEIERDLDL